MTNKTPFDKIAQDYDAIISRKGQAKTLIDHIRQATEGLRYKTVLDVGIGTGLSMQAYLNNEVTKVFASEPSQGMRQELKSKIFDDRLFVDERTIAEICLGEYDLAVFSLSLAWIENQESSLTHVTKTNPNYIVVSEQHVNETERQKIGEGYRNKDELQDAFNPIPAVRLDKFMKESKYFPLRVLTDLILSADGKSAGKLRTILYTKTKPDAVPYEEANAIFKINSFCNRRCPGCYASSNGESLDTCLYQEQLEKIPKGSLVTFRGGEPTLHPTWFEDYVQPALNHGLNVALETNGAFIGSRNYERDLDRLYDEGIHVRLSFDETHLGVLNQQERKIEFRKLARFAGDAIDKGISFGFYALGMDQHQIRRMIAGTELESSADKFHSLTFYSDISELSISGNYVDVSGRVHDGLFIEHNISFNEVFRNEKFGRMECKGMNH